MGKWVKVKFGHAEHEGFGACSVFSRAIDLERVGSGAGVKACSQFYSWKPVSGQKYNAFWGQNDLKLKFILKKP